jgi:hypothetical protein
MQQNYCLMPNFGKRMGPFTVFALSMVVRKPGTCNESIHIYRKRKAGSSGYGNAF